MMMMMMLPLESSSAVLVMISGKFVSICILQPVSC